MVIVLIDQDMFGGQGFGLAAHFRVKEMILVTLEIDVAMDAELRLIKQSQLLN